MKQTARLASRLREVMFSGEWIANTNIKAQLLQVNISPGQFKIQKINMTKISVVILSTFFTTALFGQTNTEKIKVILLGTFHFGATSDRNSTRFSDLLSQKRQLELDSISNALNEYGIDKFFLETEVSRQKWQDSLFALYKTNKLTAIEDLSDERVQIAFRTAVKKNTAMIAADFKLELPYDKINEYEQKHKNDTVNIYHFFDIHIHLQKKEKA